MQIIVNFVSKHHLNQVHLLAFGVSLVTFLSLMATDNVVLCSLQIMKKFADSILDFRVVVILILNAHGLGGEHDTGTYEKSESHLVFFYPLKFIY